LCPQITPKAYGANGIGFCASSKQFQMQASSSAHGVNFQNDNTGHMKRFGLLMS
jgi:hypothetical protein